MLQIKQKQLLPPWDLASSSSGNFWSELACRVHFRVESPYFGMSSFQSPNLGTGEESGDDWVLVEEKKCISQQLTALEILSSRNFTCLGHLGGCGLQKREHYTPPAA